MVSKMYYVKTVDRDFKPATYSFKYIKDARAYIMFTLGYMHPEYNEVYTKTENGRLVRYGIMIWIGTPDGDKYSRVVPDTVSSKTASSYIWKRNDIESFVAKDGSLYGSKWKTRGIN